MFKTFINLIYIASFSQLFINASQSVQIVDLESERSKKIKKVSKYTGKYLCKNLFGVEVVLVVRTTSY